MTDRDRELIEALLVSDAERVGAPFVYRNPDGPAAAARLTELLEENERLASELARTERNRDMWKGQVERQAAKLTTFRAAMKEAEACLVEESYFAALQAIRAALADRGVKLTPLNQSVGVVQPGVLAHAILPRPVGAMSNLPNLSRTCEVL